MSKNIQKRWVYRVNIREAELYFETGRFKYGKKSAISFIEEYNSLFNEKEISASFFRNVDALRLSNKITELRAIYYSLIYGDGENAKERFKELFGKEFTGTIEEIEAINKKTKFFIDKLNSIPKDKKDVGITFSELVAIVENSRGINIDREMKIFEFHRIYELELKKWQTSIK